MKPFFSFHQWSFRTFISLFLIGLLGACQTPQQPPPELQKGLSSEQIRALVEVGFTQSDEGWELNLGERILFGTAVDTLDPAGQTKIARLAKTLQEVGITNLIVEGHTDNIGSRQYNEKLAQRRAATIATALGRSGIPYESIIQRGFGSAHPVSDNGTPEGRMQNRRVVIIIPVE